MDDLTFPLVTRHRLIGLAFGAMHSARRGLGSDVAGSRPYLPGDDVDAIDWAASAKLSSARASDEFVVRERFAEEAPRVVIVSDRRPAMALFPEGLPWLSKARAVAVAAEIVTESAVRARGLVGYLDYAEGQPFWRAPRSQREARRVEESHLVYPTFHGPEDNLELALEHLASVRASLPAGTFVFVVSDFLAPPPYEAWLRALEFRWEVVPVIVQDPTWEQSFPPVAGVSVPIVDAAAGRRATLRLRAREAADLREAHETRLRDLLDGFLALGVDPVLVSSDDPEAIAASFADWADRRAFVADHEWRSA